MGSKFDELLDHVGTGPWNLMYFIATCYWYMMIPTQILSGVYLAPDVNHTCIIPEQHLSAHVVSSDQCSYTVNISTKGEAEELPCQEWEYDTSIYSNTLTSEFDLVCERGYLRATYQSIYMSATIFSAVAGGYIADVFGRRKVLIASHLTYLSLCIAMGFMKDFVFIMATRFLMGAVSLPTIYCLSLEVCELKYRSLVGILTGLPWAFGTMAFAGLAYLARDWRDLQLYASLPFLAIIPFLVLLDESPRWLIVRGKHTEAIKVLQKAARWNKNTLPSEDQLYKVMTEIQEEVQKEENLVAELKGRRRRWFNIGVPSLLSTSSLRTVTFIFSLNLFISALVFSGLSLSGSNYSSDPFLYIVIGGIMEIPGYSLTAPLIKWLGRKWPTFWGYVLSGLSLLLLLAIPKDISWLVMTMAMIGKLCISGAWMILMVYMCEIFPTEVRLQGIGATVMTCQMGATIAPYITDYLGPLVPWAPSAIFGVSSVVAGLVLLPLHETLGVPMPDTIPEMPEVSFIPARFRSSSRKGGYKTVKTTP